VEIGAQPAQGEVELGRQEENKERLLEIEPSVEQAEGNFDRNHRYAESGHELEHQS